MEHTRLDPPANRTVAIEIDEETVAIVEAIGLDLAATLRRGFDSEVRRARNAAEWKERHRGVIEASNAWVEKHGLPLEKYRLF